MRVDQICDFRSRVRGSRVISEGKIETSKEGLGQFLGFDASWLATAVSERRPNGVAMAEGDGVRATVDIEIVMAERSGSGGLLDRLEGEQKESSSILHNLRGCCYQMGWLEFGV